MSIASRDFADPECWRNDIWITDVDLISVQRNIAKLRLGDGVACGHNAELVVSQAVCGCCGENLDDQDTLHVHTASTVLIRALARSTGNHSSSWQTFQDKDILAYFPNFVT